MFHKGAQRVLAWVRSDVHMQEILSKASVSLVARVFGTALNFSFQVFLARLLGAHGVGIFYLALAITASMALIARMGMDYNLTRVVAASAEDEDWAKVRFVLRNAVLACAGAAIIVALTIFFSSDWISNSLFSKADLVAPLKVMAFSVVAVSLKKKFARTLQGLKLVGEATLVETAAAPTIACLVVYPFVKQFGVAGGAIAYCLGAVSAVLFAVLIWKRQSRNWTEPDICYDHGSAMSFVSESSPLFGVMVCQQLSLVTPLLILGAMKSGADAGLFYSANRTAALVGLILVAANSIVAPKIAALYHNKELATMDRVIRRSAMLVSGIAGPLLLVLIMVPGFVMAIFGTEFVESASILRVLAVGQILNVLTGSVGFVLMMTENLRSMFITALTSVVANVVLSLMLVPSYGALGAAFATAGSLAVASILRVLFVWRNLGVIALPIPTNLIPSRFR